MRGVELVQPYLQAAKEVIGRETGSDVGVGRVSMRKPPASTDEVSILIGVTGQIQGVVMIMMTKQTALNVVSHITGEAYREMDDLAESAVAEMANVISGRGGIALAALGRETTISPPAVLIGNSGGNVSTLDIPIFAIPLESSCGIIELQVALRENL
ncbi:MAG TPA: chemotaxis protein CheX [Chloroflexota bacterium]|jgi:chemotaxis protein CheX|nr:chemotaxis protein CheX [Chloroflexota bacterium]